MPDGLKCPMNIKIPQFGSIFLPIRHVPTTSANLTAVFTS